MNKYHRDEPIRNQLRTQKIKLNYTKNPRPIVNIFHPLPLRKDSEIYYSGNGHYEIWNPYVNQLRLYIFFIIISIRQILKQISCNKNKQDSTINKNNANNFFYNLTPSPFKCRNTMNKNNIHNGYATKTVYIIQKFLSHTAPAPSPASDHIFHIPGGSLVRNHLRRNSQHNSVIGHISGHQTVGGDKHVAAHRHLARHHRPRPHIHAAAQ